MRDFFNLESFSYNIFMKISKSILSILILLAMFLVYIAYYFSQVYQKESTVKKVISPIEFMLNDGNVINLTGYNTFDDDYTQKNTELSKILKISETEAFLLGNFGKYLAKNLLEGRRVKLLENDLIYYRFRYSVRLKNSPFCIIGGKPTNAAAFNRQINAIRRGKFVILDLDTEKYYPVTKENRNKIKNYVIVRKSQLKNNKSYDNIIHNSGKIFNSTYKTEDLKIIVSDSTAKLKPSRDCSSDICKEILQNISNSHTSIDMAIYGYSSVPEIEKALKNAMKRGVKIRLVYDSDAKGNNIYPDTRSFVEFIPNSRSDADSDESKSTMHDKFYIFDDKTVITGSANLSHTDMSGFNSNAIIVIKSPYAARIYKQEFEQMYSGSFHNSKKLYQEKSFSNLRFFFSPQDKAVKNAVIPMINDAKKYIYIPAFVITEQRITAELIKAKARGVDVRIIADALNSSTKHSKTNLLRASGILVKAENYAGKMHSKTMIIDDKYLIIGSMNFSNSGENYNDENLVIIEDSGAAKFYKDFFNYQWNKIPDKWLKYTPRAEGKDSIGSCEDGLDNNYDGLTDMEDAACRK